MEPNSSVTNTQEAKETVSLNPVPGIHYVKKKNGKMYSVRNDRHRFFYPAEWIKFFDNLKSEKQKNTFKLLINTGARINEVLHIKVGDIDHERNTIILRVTKVRARKGEKNPTPRTISISSQLAKSLKALTKNLPNDSYLPLLGKSATTQALKSHAKASGLNDREFSVHNIRKTHGNWLKALGIDMAEICSRLGHDSNTYLKSYSSPDIFNYKDLEQMRLILGDLYNRRMKWN